MGRHQRRLDTAWCTMTAREAFGGESAAGDDRARMRAAQALIGDARRRGMSIAGRVADEFVRLIPSINGARAERDDGTEPEAQGSTTKPGRGSSGDAGAVLRTAQIRAERAVDAALDALSDAFVTCADLIDGAADSGNGGADRETVRIRCVAGRQASRGTWLHNTTNRAAPPLRIHHGELRTTAGVVLDAVTCFEPDTVARLEAGTSMCISISVTPAVDSTPGEYYGLLFVDGLTEPPLLLSVHVDNRQDTA